MKTMEVMEQLYRLFAQEEKKQFLDFVSKHMIDENNLVVLKPKSKNEKSKYYPCNDTNWASCLD